MNDYALLLDCKTKSPYSRLFKIENEVDENLETTTIYTLLLNDPIFVGSQQFQVECKTLSMMEVVIL